jgi:hypothetical protein
MAAFGEALVKGGEPRRRLTRLAWSRILRGVLVLGDNFR